MTNRRFGNKFLKISGYVLGFLIVASVAFHFWFKAHARQLIEDLVESRSNGKIRLKVDKFSFNWFSRKMEFEDAVFISTDTVGASTSYRFSVDRIRLKVDAILPIVFDKRIIIDTLTLMRPEIRVTRLKRSEKREDATEADVSLPEEMGNIYNSIQDALQVLRVSRFLIDEGTFTLVNKIRPDQRPIVINNLFFQIDNLSVDTTIRGARDKILFSDNVILRTHDQDIIFPDERHRLSFQKFNIDLQKKLVEFDSCTIAALKTDSSSAAFTMYMDALKLIDIDFDTLYKAEVIKADSVYCVNPKFNLSVELGKKKGENSTPRLEDIIKQLTGDLQLDNVVVSNADFNINTIKDGVPTSYSFTRNNFDMEGLNIDQDARTPIKVRSFAMAIRNYENFIKDSSYSVQFDSVLFRDDRIHLSNFVFHKLDRGRVVNTFNIPQFYLGGLSWDALVFERKLKADQATLFSPRIDYTVSEKLGKEGGTSVFESLASINEVMDLAYLDIMDGSIDLKVNKNVRIQLEQATLSIESYNLLKSTQLAGIKNSLTSLDFKDGIIRAGEVLMKMKDIRYIGESGHFSAGFLDINDTRGKFALELEDVLVDKMLVDEKRGDIISSDISWGKAKLNLKAGSGGKELNSVLNISNVKGKNTTVTGLMGNISYSTHLDELAFAELDKRPGSSLVLEGLRLKGSKLDIRGKNSYSNVTSYEVTDEQRAVFTGINHRKNSEGGEFSLEIPQLNFIPFVQSYLDGKAKLNDVVIHAPLIKARLLPGDNKAGAMPSLSINSIRIEDPRIEYEKKKDNGSFSLDWDGRGSGNAIVISDFVNRKENGWDLLVKKISLSLAKFGFKDPKGKKFTTGTGSIQADITDLSLREKTNGLDWQALLSSMNVKDIVFDSLGRKKQSLYIDQMGLQDLGLSSSSVNNIKNLTKANLRFRVSGFDGSLTGPNNVLNWNGLNISRPAKTFGLDSLSLVPLFTPDSFFAKQKLQKDHLKLRTGKIFLTNADIEAFLSDNSIMGSQLLVDGLNLEIIKDTRLPYDSSLIKKLPVNMLRQLGLPVFVETLEARNGTVSYTEISSSGKSIIIPISRISLRGKNVKSQDFNVGDSLDVSLAGTLLDSVRIELNLKQSYEDDLVGMNIEAKFLPTRMQVLNAALVPLGKIYIKSGDMDSAILRVKANEYLAFGEMQMKYSGLKVLLLKDGEGLEGRNTKGLMSFLANTFVIRNKNKKDPALLFVIRNRNRSVFNYLVKIATGGFQSSIGVGNNKKTRRQYHAELKERGLSPFQ